MIEEQILELRQEDEDQQTINFIESLNDEQKTYEVKSELGLAYIVNYIKNNSKEFLFDDVL